MIPKRRNINYYTGLFLLWRCDPTRVMVSSFLRFLDHTQRRITVGRTPLDEWSARRRDLYLTTHNTYNRQASMPPVVFEPTISAGERPQTYTLDRVATGACPTRCIKVQNTRTTLIWTTGTTEIWELIIALFQYSLQFTLTLRRLMSYIYGAPILDVSRSHTTTQHSR